MKKFISIFVGVLLLVSCKSLTQNNTSTINENMHCKDKLEQFEKNDTYVPWWIKNKQ